MYHNINLLISCFSLWYCTTTRLTFVAWPLGIILGRRPHNNHRFAFVEIHRRKYYCYRIAVRLSDRPSISYSLVQQLCDIHTIDLRLSRDSCSSDLLRLSRLAGSVLRETEDTALSLWRRRKVKWHYIISRHFRNQNVNSRNYSTVFVLQPNWIRFVTNKRHHIIAFRQVEAISLLLQH